MLSISTVNKFPEDEFIKIFGNVVEHYPKVANYLFTKLPIENVESLWTLAEEFLKSIRSEDKECVLKLHPDLAGKVAEMENLTAESSEEQKSAGLNEMTIEEKTRITDLNNAYKSKFGFPFVICAKENKLLAIFKGLEDRMKNARDKELEMGIGEVAKICKLRILNIVS